MRACGWAEAARAALGAGELRSVRIDAKLAGRDKYARVDIGPGATLHFDRDDEELDRAVRAWLVARRVLPASQSGEIRETG